MKQTAITLQAKPRIAIVTIYPFDRGGVLSLLKVAHSFFEQFFDPTIVFLSFDPAVSMSLRSLRFTSRVQTGEREGMRFIAIGARWPLWHPGHYRRTLKQWREALAPFDYFFVVSGTAIAAHPLVLLKKKFALWIAATHLDDRQQRMQEELRGMRALLDRTMQPFMKRIERAVLKYAATVCVTSLHTKNELARIDTRSDAAVVGYPLVVKAPACLTKPQLLAVGRFEDPRKNLPMLVRVFHRIYKSMPEARLVIIGTSPLGIASHANCAACANIEWRGRVSVQERDLAYQQSSCLLITSYQEGLGIVGLEAMAHGVPVISTDCGGPRDFIRDSENGFLVPINNDAAMVTTALYLLQDLPLRLRLGRQARAFVASHYSYAQIYQLLQQNLMAAYPELESVFMQRAHSQRSTEELHSL